MLARFGVFCLGMCWKCCWHVYVLEAMLACFVLFRPGTILIRHGRRARGCRTGMAFIWVRGCFCQFFDVSILFRRNAVCSLLILNSVFVKTSLTVGVWWFFFAVRRWPKMMEPCQSCSMLYGLFDSANALHVAKFSAGSNIAKHTHSLIWYLYLSIKHTCRQPMEWQQLQTSAQHEAWSLIETLEAARRRLDFDQTELRSISPRTTVAVQTYCRVTLQRVDACIDILKNLRTELWRMNNLPLELIHQCNTGDQHWRCWHTSSHQLNRRVLILTQRGKKSRAPQFTLAVQKKNWITTMCFWFLMRLWLPVISQRRVDASVCLGAACY